ALAAGQEIAVTAHVEVEVAISVVVEEGGGAVERGAELGRCHTRLGGDVREGPIAVVAIEDVLSVLRHVEVRMAVVVVVTPRAAETVTCAGNARPSSDVGEGPIVVVVV